jgi:hypothetical protein
MSLYIAAAPSAFSQFVSPTNIRRTACPLFRILVILVLLSGAVRRSETQYFAHLEEDLGRIVDADELVGTGAFCEDGNVCYERSKQTTQDHHGHWAYPSMSELPESLRPGSCR